MHRPKARPWGSAPYWRRHLSAELAGKAYNFGTDRTDRIPLACVLKVAVCIERFVGPRDAQLRRHDDHAEMRKYRAQQAQAAHAAVIAGRCRHESTHLAPERNMGR